VAVRIGFHHRAKSRRRDEFRDRFCIGRERAEIDLEQSLHERAFRRQQRSPVPCV